MSGKWTSAEDAMLRKCASDGMTMDEAANLIGRTRPGCKTRARVLEVSFHRPTPRPAMERGPWESRLVEPWSEYSARKKAERAAKREQQEKAA